MTKNNMGNNLLERGAFLFSLDTELAWGSISSSSYAQREKLYAQTRPLISSLLRLLEKHQIKATWAVVGHLFLEECRPQNGVKHPEIVRPAYRWFQGDWFDADPCTDGQQDPFWYGRDIVAQIQNCKTPQEIGSHGFSHLVVGDPGCSAECFESELRACCNAAQEWGIDLKSFIYPRNSVGHRDVLARNGFLAYRAQTPRWFRRLPRGLRNLGRSLDDLVVHPPTPAPQWEDGLWNLPDSYFYGPREGWRKGLPMSLRVRRIKWGLHRAARRRELFHLWLHPYNLAADAGAMLQGLDAVLAEVARLRDLGKMDNPTMGDLAASLEQRPQALAA